MLTFILFPDFFHMGDQVQVRIEEMLPELADLEENKIFSAAELQKMMKTRKGYEIEIISKNANLTQFRRYIQHEIAVESLKRLRQSKLNIKKLGVSNFSIIRRAHYLYTRALKKFSNDKDLWLEHIKFCADSGSVNSLNKVIMRALRYHPREAAFWSLAADRQGKLGNVESARNILLRGLRAKPIHPLPLWESMLGLELMVASKVVENIHTVQVVFDNAMTQLASEHEREAIAMSLYKQIRGMAGFDPLLEKCKNALLTLKGEEFIQALEEESTGVDFIEDTLPVVA